MTDTLLAPQIVRDVDKGERPPMKDIPAGLLPQDYLELMQACWQIKCAAVHFHPHNL